MRVIVINWFYCFISINWKTNWFRAAEINSFTHFSCAWVLFRLVSIFSFSSQIYFKHFYRIFFSVWFSLGLIEKKGQFPVNLLSSIFLLPFLLLFRRFFLFTCFSLFRYVCLCVRVCTSTSTFSSFMIAFLFSVLFRWNFMFYC